MLCCLEKNTAIVVLNLAGIAKYKYERRNKMDSVIISSKIKAIFPIAY